MVAKDWREGRIERNCLMGMRFYFGVMKGLRNMQNQWLCNIVNVLNATKSFTLKWLICYVDFSLINYLKYIRLRFKSQSPQCLCLHQLLLNCLKWDMIIILIPTSTMVLVFFFFFSFSFHFILSFSSSIGRAVNTLDQNSGGQCSVPETGSTCAHFFSSMSLVYTIYNVHILSVML